MGGLDSEQAKVLDFMGLPEAYGAPATVERIETHASIVFLAGPFAYKVKRAVKYPFLDFSTLEKRRLALLNELRLNRRTAPQIYLEVIPVTIGEDGSLHLGGKGREAEWVLQMKRFDQAGLYDRMAAEKRLPLAEMPRLAKVVAAFHAAADRVLTAEQAVKPFEAILAENEAALAANLDIFPREAASNLTRLTRETFDRLAPLLSARARGGYVRHCHGDLHLRNIVEIEGEPVLFDALEFDDRLATIDVFYDLAFLLMDLGKRGLEAHANSVLNAYLEAEGSTGNLIGLATLPLFLSLRAMIRAKVELLRAQNAGDDAAQMARDEARNYFDLARNFMMPPGPRLIAIGGLSGSGKSAIARAVAPRIGAFPGAIHIRSDVERKRLFGVAPAERLPKFAYTSETSNWVYAMCRKRARLALERGQSAIIDAVHAKPEEREATAAVAAAAGVPFVGLWLEAPAEILRTRVEKRKGDVSDATPSVVEEQLGYDIGPQSFEIVDASLPLEKVVDACLEPSAERREAHRFTVC
jgi:aminoglycoside phosphotransferase family enzyme/predicted kinase